MTEILYEKTDPRESPEEQLALDKRLNAEGSEDYVPINQNLLTS